jgi:peptide chain release factor 2
VQGFSVDCTERSVGEEAGIKSVELRVVGRFAYGYLKGEAGLAAAPRGGG